MTLFFLCALPLSVHIFDDRKGDHKKINDLIALALFSGVIAFLYWKFFDIAIYRTLFCIAGWHFFLFDYLIVAVLRMNGVIHPKARWFSYIGKSARTDQLWGRLTPAQRVAIRAAVFAIGTVIYFV